MALSDEIFNYFAVAASQTTKQIGATGHVGDYIDHMVVVPGSSAADSVVLHDGGNALFTLPAMSGGTGCPQPYSIPLGIHSKVSGGFNVTTGSAVTLLVVGHFT